MEAPPVPETPRHKQELLTIRDIWDRCTNLQPGAILDGLYYFAAKRGDEIVPLTVEVEGSDDPSRLVFIFHVNQREMFAAHAMQAEGDGFGIRASYTYNELRTTLQHLADADTEIGFVEIESHTPAPAAIPEMPPQTEVSDESPHPVEITAPAPPPHETSQERIARLRSAALRTYLSAIEALRARSGFDATIQRFLRRYNDQNRLLDKITTITTSDPREYWGNPPIELRKERSVPFDATPATVEEALGMLEDTLIIRVLYGTHHTTDRNAIIPLHETHIDALAVFRQELLDLGKPHSFLREALRKAGLKQVKLQFAGNVRYGEKDMEYRLVPIMEIKVP